MAAAVGGIVFGMLAGGPLAAQPLVPGLPDSATKYQLSPSVQLDQADGNLLALLERVKALRAAKQWGEAIETLVEAMETSGNNLIGVTERRFVSVRDYGHLQLAALPPEALALYRSRVDAQAKKLCDEGIAQRDSRRLLEVLDHAFASSWGDSALYALGEIALESGDAAAARSYWEKIIPVQPPDDSPRTWLCVPDTELDLAAVRARLVLASILEGSLGRAREELARFAKLHPDARGRFGGIEVNYAAALTKLLDEAAHWPRLPPEPDWPTFAGSPTRSKTAPGLIDAGEVAWRVGLGGPSVTDRPVWGTLPPRGRVAEDGRRPLSYHPVVAGNLVLVNNLAEILAVDWRTGKPAWGHDRAVIYEDPLDEEARKSYVPAGAIGVPRFTMTVFGSRLVARMGAAPTRTGREMFAAAGSGYLVCLDLASEGRLLWKEAAKEGWAFEGSPVADAGSVYVAMRRSDVLPHLYVACFDAQTGHLRWRQSVCAAESPAHGMIGEITHHLLTLHGDTLYYNTSLGAVAALAARDGRLLWVSLYPRVLEGDLAKPPPHASRDLTPCLFDRGVLLVAPADSRRIFALEAATGQILWQTGPELEDVVHLLGVAGDTLIASGYRLYWISLKPGEQGKVKHVWPEGEEKLGQGRGVLAGNSVLWPTANKIYVFDQASGRLIKDIALAPRRATGGNLLVAGGRLLIATDRELIALGPTARPPQNAAGDVTLAREAGMSLSAERGTSLSAAKDVACRPPTPLVPRGLPPDPASSPSPTTDQLTTGKPDSHAPRR